MTNYLIEEAEKVFKSTKTDQKRLFIAKVDAVIDAYVFCLNATTNQQKFIEARIREHDFIKNIFEEGMKQNAEKRID